MDEARRIAVLFVVPRLGGGGAERVIGILLRHLDRARFRPALALQHLDGEYMDDVPPDVEIISLGPGRLRTRLPRLLALAWRRRPEILFTTLSYVNLLVATVASLLPPGTAHVAREASIPARRLGAGLGDRVQGYMYRRCLPRVDRLVCQSRDMLDDLVGTWSFPPDRATVIHNPVDADRVRALAAQDGESLDGPPGGIRLLAVGRLVPQKGYDLLLDALARTPPRYRLTILGEGPEGPNLERRARDLGIADRVHLRPFTRNPYPLMARADALVLSSRHEGFPNVLLEAGACGTPTVAFGCPGGIAEIIIEGESGLVIPPEDPAALAEAIAGDTYLAMDPAKIEAGIRARFGLEIIVPRYEEMLSDTVRRPV